MMAMNTTQYGRAREFWTGLRHGVGARPWPQPKSMRSHTMGVRIGRAGSKIGNTSKRIGIAAAGTASAYIIMQAMKALHDTIKEHHHNRNVPDVRMDVEIIPTYHGQISPLIYALGETIPFATRIAEEMQNIHKWPVSLLIKMRDKLLAILRSIKSAAVRSMCSYWLGLISAELLGRGIAGAINRDHTSINVHTAQPSPLNGVPTQVSSYSQEALEMYINWASLGESALMGGRKALSLGSKMWTGVKNAFGGSSGGGGIGKTFTKGTRVVGGAAGATVGNITKKPSMLGRTFKVIDKVSTPLMAAGVVSQLSTDARARRQMNDWDRQQQTGQPEPPEGAWHAHGYSNAAEPEPYIRPEPRQRIKIGSPPQTVNSKIRVPVNVHRHLVEEKTNLSLDERDHRLRKLVQDMAQEQHWKQEESALPHEAAVLKDLAHRHRHNKKLLISLGIGTSLGLGASALLLRRKKNYARFQPVSGPVLSTLWHGISRSGEKLTKIKQTPRVRVVEDEIADALISLGKTGKRGGTRSEIRSQLGAALWHARRSGAKASHRPVFNISPPLPTTPINPTRLKRLITAGGLGGAGIVGGGYEVGKKVGRHEERGRIRKLTDMEPV